MLAAHVAEDADALDLPVARGGAGEADQHRPRVAGAGDQQHLAVPGRAAHLRGEDAHVLRRRRQQLRPPAAAQRLGRHADHLGERPVGEDHGVLGVGEDDALANAPHDVGQLARLGLQPDVNHRHRDAVGHDAQQPLDARVELTRAAGDLQHADRRAADDQRRDHQRAEAAGADGGVRHPRVGRGPVGDEHRRLGGERDLGHADVGRHRHPAEVPAQPGRGPAAQLAARLVQQQDRGGVGAEHPLGHLDHLGEQRVGITGAQCGLGDLLQRLDLHRAPDEQSAGHQRARAGHQFLGQERFGHVVVGAVAQATDPRRGARQRAQHQDGRGGQLGPAPQLLDDVVAAHAGQHEVEHHQVGLRRALERLQRPLAGRHRLDVVALGHQEVAQQDGCVAVVLDDEDARGVHHHRLASPAAAARTAVTGSPRLRLRLALPHSGCGVCWRRGGPARRV